MGTGKVAMKFSTRKVKKDRQNGGSIASFQKIIQVEWKYEPGFKNRAILWACPETLVQSPDVHPRTGQSGFPGSLGLR